MPRKSAAALSVAPATTGVSARIRPPADLPPAARAVFMELVAATDSRHFTPADVPMLGEYATACALARRASKALAEEGPVLRAGRDGRQRASPWLVVMEKAHRSMIALSMRLRVSPQGRMSAKKAGVLAKHPGSRGLAALMELDDDKSR